MIKYFSVIFHQNKLFCQLEKKYSEVVSIQVNYYCRVIETSGLVENLLTGVFIVWNFLEDHKLIQKETKSKTTLDSYHFDTEGNI